MKIHKIHSWLILLAFLAGCGVRPPAPTATSAPTIDFSRTATLEALAFPSATPTLTNAQKATSTPTAISTTTRGIQPPACTFPLAQTTAEESKPETYTFSEPKVVMTSKYQIDIIEWLPDSQNALIMPMDDHLFDGFAGYLQTIELFNPETQATQIYATRREGEEGAPAWNPALNAVVYPAKNALGRDTNNRLKSTRQIRISYGNPDNTQLLADNLPQYYVTVKPDGSQMAYLTEKQLIKLDTSLNALAPIAFDRKAMDFKHKVSDNVNVLYKMAWRPNSSQIFVYNWAYDDLGYAYILDADAGKLCNLNFDGWAFVAHWSPNGRYLAIARAQGIVPVQSSDLAVLDTATGNLYTLGLPQEIEGKHYIKDFAWAPDNRHLFMMGGNYEYGNSSTFNGMLFLGDFISGQFNRVLPSHTFTAIWAGSNLAWSPNGSNLLVNCPIAEKSSQVCLISVQTSGQ
jgi:Tol biopolymer transport system component